MGFGYLTFLYLQELGSEDVNISAVGVVWEWPFEVGCMVNHIPDLRADGVPNSLDHSGRLQEEPQQTM